MAFENYKLANNAISELASSISAGSTSFLCKTGDGGKFPSTFPFFITLEKIVTGVVTKREVLKITNRATDAFTCTRSADYCLASASATTQTNTAFSFDTGDIISLRLVAENIKDINTELERIVSTDIAGLNTSKLSISDYQNGTKVYAATSTGTDAYAITLSPVPSAYLTGMTFKFQADVVNTGAATLNVNSLGVKTIKKQHDQDLTSGDIEAGQIVTVSYDGTNFQMDSQVATIPTIDINSQTEATDGDMDNDVALIYEASASANRKQKINTYRATDVEALAGTATNKFVTPAQVTLTTPKKILFDYTPHTFTNSSAENIVFTTTVPAGGLGTTNYVRGLIHFTLLNDDGNAVNTVIKLYYGTTVIATITKDFSQPNLAYFGLDFYVVATGATNTQTGIMRGTYSSATAFLFETATGTATEDSTASKTLKVTVQIGSAAADVTSLYGYAELIK